jgi:hypothetical protein
VIKSLDECSVGDAAPVLAKLTPEHLMSIEVNTVRYEGTDTIKHCCEYKFILILIRFTRYNAQERDLKLDPRWQDLWEAHCAKLSMPQAKVCFFPKKESLELL